MWTLTCKISGLYVVLAAESNTVLSVPPVIVLPAQLKLPAFATAFTVNNSKVIFLSSATCEPAVLTLVPRYLTIASV